MKRLFFLLTVCTATLCASAANHYVSQATGNDSNDGTSWATAKKTIAKGFSACSDGDTLFVAAGTYNERVTITTNHFVSIMGGYDGTGMRDPELFETIMDGTDLGKILIKSEKESSVPLIFDGLTLQNAEYSSSASAVYLRGNMTVNNCIIRNCHSMSSGGAIYVESPTANAAQPVISNCIIELCSATGSGGAIYNKGGLVENCIIRGCTGNHAVIYNKTGIIRNTVIHNCAAQDGDWPNTGGVYNPGGTIINCTFANNYGSQYAGLHSDSYVYNTVCWGNRSEEGFADPANYISGSPSSNNIADQGFNSTPFVSLHLATNNEDANGPHFVAPTNFVGLPKNAGEIAAMQNADFSIEAGSFLIDKGLAAQAPDTDLKGVVRPKGTGVDVGAYEYDPNAAPVALQSFAIYQDTLYTRVESADAFTVLFTPRNATNKSLTWTIDDPTVATIDDHGMVTGVGVGTTIARATSVDGGFTDNAVVVVEEKLPVIYPNEVLAADTLYKQADYTVPSWIPFLIAKEAARVDSFQATDAEKAAIAGKLEAMYAAAAQLVGKEEPYNMVANINGDPHTRMAFAWFTNEGITDGMVQILPMANATAADFEGSNVISVTATPTTTKALRYAVSTSGILKAAALDTKTSFKYVSHKAIAENLTPGTAYSWRVGCAGHWSEIGHFRTQDAEQGEFSFIYMSDSHIQNQEYVDYAHRCATTAAATVPEARFCLFPGDFVETGTTSNSEWEWERWFEESIKPVIMQMPMVVTDGNHDDSGNLNYTYHFNTDNAFNLTAQTKPQFDGITYSFMYGDVLFMVYSLQDWWKASGSSASARRSTYLSTDVRNWFYDQVEAHPEAKYRVTLSHKNIFSGSGHSVDDEIPMFRDIMLPIFADCQIDLAIQGHDHCYEVIGPVNPWTRAVVEGAVTDVETVAVDGNSNVTGKKGGTFTTDDGTLYFIGATCGRKRYYPYSQAEMEAKYTTNGSLLYDGAHHDVENYFDLFTGMFGQPGDPSFTKFTVKADGIYMDSYKVDQSGNATLINSMRVVRNAPHTAPTGMENVQVEVREGEKFIRNGQLFILRDGKIYNVLGQKVTQE